VDKINEKNTIIFSKIFELLSKEYNDFFEMNTIFTYILESIINSNKNLSTGSIILKDEDGYFRYIAVKGHDYNLLKGIKYRKNDIHKDRFYGITILKIKPEIERYDLFEKLVKGGNLLKIKSILSIPININNEVVGFLTLDNYTNDIFSDEIISLAKVYTDFIGIIYENIIIKKELNLHNAIIEKANITNGILFNKDFLIKKTKEFFENNKEFNFAVIKLKKEYDNKIFKIISRRINRLFIDDYVAFDNNTFYILSEYISNYYFENDLKNSMEKPILFENEDIIPEYDYSLYIIPDEINSIDDLIFLLN
jgi:hypothetical protein